MAGPVACPRCEAPTQVSLQTAQSTHARIEVDQCPRCNGLWLDGVEVAQAFRALGQHAVRVGDLLAAGARRGHGIGRCPRCQAETLELPYFDMWLDMCLSCFGMWFDGDEVQAVARTADRQDGIPAPEPPGGYRERAVAAAREEKVACGRCGKTVPLDRTLVTANGLLCDPCGQDDLAGTADDDDPEIAALTRKLRRGSSGIGEGVLAVLKGLGTFLLLVLSAGANCPTCGCRHHSRCHH